MHAMNYYIGTDCFFITPKLRRAELKQWPASCDEVEKMQNKS